MLWDFNVLVKNLFLCHHAWQFNMSALGFLLLVVLSKDISAWTLVKQSSSFKNEYIEDANSASLIDNASVY